MHLTTSPFSYTGTRFLFASLSHFNDAIPPMLLMYDIAVVLSINDLIFFFVTADQNDLSPEKGSWQF